MGTCGIVLQVSWVYPNGLFTPRKWECKSDAWQFQLYVHLEVRYWYQWHRQNVSLLHLLLLRLTEPRIRIYSHQAKTAAKAKKRSKNKQTNQRINDKHRRKFSLPLLVLVGVNGPWAVHFFWEDTATVKHAAKFEKIIYHNLSFCSNCYAIIILLCNKWFWIFKYQIYLISPIYDNLITNQIPPKLTTARTVTLSNFF